MRRQLVLNKPAKVLVGEYSTKSGQVKNRYKKNTDVKVVKAIYHNDHVLFK